MAIFTVTTADDVVDAGDGVLSLREAVAQSNITTTVDTIQFAATLEGQTLVLSGGELTLRAWPKTNSLIYLVFRLGCGGGTAARQPGGAPKDQHSAA
jgi:hypothetical protein